MTYDGSRELAKVASVFRGKEDHGILTINISMEGPEGGWGQGFGGLALTEELADDFEYDLKKIFGVKNLSDLVGKQCYVLRSFTTWGAMIEGIETLNGKKFTITKWRKKHFPETKNPLDDKKESILRSIESFKRRISDLEDDLKRIDSQYKNWG